MAHTLILTVGEHVGEQLVGAVFAGLLARSGLVGGIQDTLAILQQFLFPLGSGHRVVKYREAVTQRADVLHQGIGLDAIGEPVDTQHIVLQISRQHRSIVGQQFAALRLDRGSLGEHIIGLFVPLGGLNGGGLEQIPHDYDREQQHDSYHEAIAHQDMPFVVLFHLFFLVV